MNSCNHQSEISRLEILLYIEKLKTKILQYIIKTKIDTDINSLFTFDTETLQINLNIDEQITIPQIANKISLIIRENGIDNIQKLPKLSKRNAKIIQSNQSTNQSIEQNHDNLVEQSQEQSKELSHKQIPDQRPEQSQKNNTYSLNKDLINETPEQLVIIFDTMINKLNNMSDNYIKFFEEIKIQRNSVYKSFTYQEYLKLLDNQVNTVKTILESKKYTKQQIQSLISTKFLTPLETRLLSYNNYIMTVMTPKEIGQLPYFLNSTCPTSLVKFTNDQLIERFNTKTCFNLFFLGCLSIKQLLLFILVNKNNDNQNIIYVNDNKPNDNFKFYKFNGYNEAKNKLWTMDCRLEKLTVYLGNNLCNMIITIFTKIYKDCFGDNFYRKDYGEHFNILNSDGKQLLVNLCICSDIFKLSNILRNIVHDYCLYSPTENDIFDFESDDKYQQKKYLELSKEHKIIKDNINIENPIINNISKLFTTIDIKECVQIYHDILQEL